MYVIIKGNPVDGIEVFGPFEDSEAGVTFAENNFQGDDYWITELYCEEAI